MKKIFLSLTLLFILRISAMCQITTGANGYLPNYDPPSPEASALGKYAEHPVGYFTGTPKIEIPLFEIKTGRITVPISLSYHGSGVKVNEVASRTGIGWVLNAGGVVARTAKGFADDVSGAGFGITYGGVPSYSSEVGYFANIASSTPSTVSTVVSQATGFSTVYDLEPDPHFYNFGNKTGTIYFTSPTTPFTTNDDPLIINGPYNGSNQFVITTEDGLVYTFAAAEGTDNQTYSGISYSYTSAWYLTQIHDPVTGKNVTFTYRTDMPATLNYSYQKSVSMAPPCPTGGGNVINQNAILVENPQVLSTITYDEGYIQFNANYSRQDLTGDRAYTQINQYIYTGTGNTPTLLRGFNLGYTTTSNGTAQENYRLYLDNLTETGSDGSLKPPYVFSYINRISVPQRNSPQQDIWGYYNANGAAITDPPQFPKVYVHTNGLQTDYLPFDNPASPAPTVIPGVETSSNPATVAYGTLSQITYPTQGYTTYSYEINQFNTYYSGGGIRIKQINDYSSSGQQLLSKTYQYNNSGLLAGPFPQVAYPASSGLIQFSLNQTILGSSQGNYVGYGQVTETQISTTGSTNGTTNYYYTTTADVPVSVTTNTNTCGGLSNLTSIMARTYFPFFEMQSKEEQRGKLIKEVYFDLTATPRKEIDYTYTLSSSTQLGVHADFIVYDNTQPNLTVDVNLAAIRSINAEKMLLTSKIETDFLGPAPQTRVVNTTNYTYCGGAHNDQFLRNETHYGSGIVPDPRNPGSYIPDNSTQVTYKYPFDYGSAASGGIMRAMVAMNYISPVINQLNAMSKHLSTATPITYYTDAKINDFMQNPYFSPGSEPNMIVPRQVFQLNLTAPVQQQTGSNPTVEVADPSNPGSLYEKRLQYLSYDVNSNPTLIQHDNLYEALSWSYLGEHLLSKTNTTNPNAATFSFPPESWNAVNDVNAKTGGVDFVWGGSQTAFPFSPDGVNRVVVSFWAKGGTFNITAVNPSATNIIINQTAPATWQYYSFTLSTVGTGWAGAPVYLTGTATLDDVSISSATGLTTNYAYDALLRLQLIMNPSGKTRSFKYDPFSRLVNTLDENGDIVKHVDYHYIGQ